jgi:ATP-dependent Clp protease, protease subunit
MIHQPLSGTQGQATDLEIHAKHLMKLKRNLIDLYVKHTGKAYEVIGSHLNSSLSILSFQPRSRAERSIDRDFWMDSTEARDFGLLDEVVLKKPSSEVSRDASGDMSPPN